ncbi:hypothetical protein [Achromobacter phage Motura]|uniref:Uncharacterized protein n=1 Tax=Achromobacter phage Motura TaxID=2591403 RepID=A0A514CSP0_9CAUD|nr:hypothetical protein H1O15_gp315 [Achromobacter phage Motura]QDH83491.1 hypothetical protein [Achromobacter phage Motura]
MQITKVEFSVAAGKYDLDEKNYKYCDTFKSFDEAQEAAKTCAGYHFIEVEMYEYWEAGGAEYMRRTDMDNGEQRRFYKKGVIWIADGELE